MDCRAARATSLAFIVASPVERTWLCGVRTVPKQRLEKWRRRVGVHLRAGDGGEPVRQLGGGRALDEDLDEIGVGVRQMVREQDDRLVADGLQVGGAGQGAVGVEELGGQDVVHSARQGVRRIVRPGAVALGEAVEQARHGRGSGRRYLVLERAVYVVCLDQVLTREKRGDGGDQAARAGVAPGRDSLHVYPIGRWRSARSPCGCTSVRRRGRARPACGRRCRWCAGARTPVRPARRR